MVCEHGFYLDAAREPARAGVTMILLPARNRENLQDLDEEFRQGIEVLFVDSLQEVVDATLLSPVSSAERFLLAPPQNLSRPEPTAGASPIFRL